MQNRELFIVFSAPLFCAVHSFEPLSVSAPKDFQSSVRHFFFLFALFFFASSFVIYARSSIGIFTIPPSPKIRLFPSFMLQYSHGKEVYRMLELSEEQLNNLNKDALVIIAASLQD